MIPVLDLTEYPRALCSEKVSGSCALTTFYSGHDAVEPRDIDYRYLGVKLTSLLVMLPVLGWRRLGRTKAGPN